MMGQTNPAGTSTIQEVQNLNQYKKLHETWSADANTVQLYRVAAHVGWEKGKRLGKSRVGERNNWGKKMKHGDQFISRVGC